jgi:hypothetical protein
MRTLCTVHVPLEYFSVFNFVNFKTLLTFKQIVFHKMKFYMVS